jgi:endonuclease III
MTDHELAEEMLATELNPATDQALVPEGTRKLQRSSKKSPKASKPSSASKPRKGGKTPPRGKKPAASAATTASQAKTPGRLASAARRRERVRTVIGRLRLEYPDARCALLHGNPVQLLVATILSAQCTDERVNQVTPALFRKYPDVAAFANANIHELEEAIHSTGFFHNKARNILACCRQLVLDFGGEVPRDMEELVRLPGVGRKTANVVRGACFDFPAITVDTHVGRISRLLGLTRHQDPVKVESELASLIPEADWWFYSSGIIWHGRNVCFARRPECHRCTLSDLCPSSRATTGQPEVAALTLAAVGVPVHELDAVVQELK